MTENESIEFLKGKYPSWGCDEDEYENAITAIQALEEIQQYRAIGTVEELKALKEKEELFDRNIKMFYKIGLEIRKNAIDEFAEAMKQKAEEIMQNPDIMLDCKKCTIWKIKDIDEIAEQMKAGGKSADDR